METTYPRGIRLPNALWEAIDKEAGASGITWNKAVRRRLEASYARNQQEVTDPRAVRQVAGNEKGRRSAVNARRPQASGEATKE